MRSASTVRELEQLGMHLGIKLSDADTAIMIEEMDARIHGVNYKLFCKWWFSDSRIAAKVKRASLKKNDGPIKMFRRMDRDKDGWITMANDSISTRKVEGRRSRPSVNNHGLVGSRLDTIDISV